MIHRITDNGLQRWTAALTVLMLAVGASGTMASASETMLDRGRSAPVDRVKWQPVLEVDFTEVTSLEPYVILEGTWELRDGNLHAVGGDRNRGILLGQVGGDRLRFEFDATVYANPDGTTGDISLLINASPEQRRGAADYMLTTGSYFNTCTTFYRRGRRLARTEYSPVVAGASNRVVIEFDGGHIRYWLNDTILLEAWDTDPLTVDQQRFVGIRTWNTHLVIGKFRVLKPTS